MGALMMFLQLTERTVGAGFEDFASGFFRVFLDHDALLGQDQGEEPPEKPSACHELN